MLWRRRQLTRDVCNYLQRMPRARRWMVVGGIIEVILAAGGHRIKVPVRGLALQIPRLSPTPMVVPRWPTIRATFRKGRGTTAWRRKGFWPRSRRSCTVPARAGSTHLPPPQLLLHKVPNTDEPKYLFKLFCLKFTCQENESSRYCYR